MSELTKEELKLQVIEQLLNQLELKKAEVAKAIKPFYLTGGIFPYSEGLSNHVDIALVREERKLTEILAFLKGREKDYVEAAGELGTDPSFKWRGFTTAEWKDDVQTRVNALQIVKKRAELAELEIRVNKHVPQEYRDAKDFEDLQKQLLGK